MGLVLTIATSPASAPKGCQLSNTIGNRQFSKMTIRLAGQQDDVLASMPVFAVVRSLCNNIQYDECEHQI